MANPLPSQGDLVSVEQLEGMMREGFPGAPDGLIAALVLSFLESQPPSSYVTDDGVAADNGSSMKATELEPGLQVWMRDLCEAAGEFYPLKESDLKTYRAD